MKDIIVFGEDWGALPSSTQYLIGHLAKHRKVIWINSIGLRSPSLNFRDLSRLWQKCLASLQSAQALALKQSDMQSLNNRDTHNFRVISPKTLPVAKTTFSRKLARMLLLRQILPVMEEMNIESPILWCSLPTAVDMVGYLNESSVVYYCGDDFSALAGVSHKTVIERETELLKKADLVLTASDTLAAKFPFEKTHCIEHGVDFDLFSQTCLPAADLPKDKRPIAGFYGSINQWLDINLLVKTAQRLPHWHFVFIGHCHIDISQLEQLNNVTFLGYKPHDELPRYSQHWTVSLLPFILNEQIKACDPLKLSEYLAAGTPVIATRFHAAERYMGFVHIIDNDSDMVTALEVVAKASFNKALAPVIQRSVLNKTWRAQSYRVASLLDSL